MKKELSFILSIIPILSLICAATLSIFFWKAGMHIPLMIGVIVASIIAMMSGWSWREIEKMMINGVSRAMPAVFILLIIGIIVGTWIASGVIPTMVYYGLSIMQPSQFVPLVALITGIISMTLGSSFTSIATVGLAFMIIGEGLGFAPGLIAGAIISGAYLGDKLSPFSDTTNIAPAMAETDLFSHIKHMLWDTIPAFVLSLLLYWILGNSTFASNTVDTSEVSLIIKGIESTFVIHPLLLLMPVFTILLMMKRVPAILALAIVGILGAVLAVLVQGATISSIIQVMTSGLSVDSGVAIVDSLLNGGGLTSMLSTIGLLIIATSFGGILEETGAFEVLTRKMMQNVRSTGSLISTTIFSTFVVAFASGAQFLAIILPARTFVKKYKDMGIDTKNLSRCVEAAGTVGINLVPWSVPAIFAAGILGVNPVEFIPFIFFAILVPIINIIFGFTGWTIAKKDYSISNETYTKGDISL